VEEARVSVLDRGFLFGDGVYEVIPVYGGRLFRLQAHLDRLDRSLAGIHLANPMSLHAWEALLAELVRRNRAGDLSVYLQVTRGVAKRDHAFPTGAPPTVVAMASPLPQSPLTAGVAAIVARDIRWDLCDIKAITLLPNALLRQRAVEAGAMEAILVRHGFVTEGAASNVFVVEGERVATPPRSAQLLPGITRDLVLELMAAGGIACEERMVTVDELHAASEVWLTSSTREVVPVVRLEGAPVGGGVPGPLWRVVYDLYQDYKRRFAAGQG
jgi:D-alanine transaminase